MYVPIALKSVYFNPDHKGELCFFSFISQLFNHKMYKLNMDIIMSALTLCAQLINYELLTTTMLNWGGGRGGKTVLFCHLSLQ